MATKVTVPHLGESVVEATIGKWLVQEGDKVEKDQPLVELMTDKADSEVPSPTAGVVAKVLRSEDDSVAVGDALCEIDESAQAQPEPKSGKGDGKSSADATARADSGGRSAGAATSTARGSGDSAQARGGQGGGATPGEGAGETKGGDDEAGGEPGGPTSPSVRKLAREMGVDLSAVKGTGKDERITRDDVMHAAQETSAPPTTAPEEEAAQLEAKQSGDFTKQDGTQRATERQAMRPPAMPQRPVQAPSGEQPTGPKGAFKLPPYVPKDNDEIIPFSRRRRIIADHMVYSKMTAPDVVTFAECDVHRTSKLRDAHKGEAKRSGVNLSFLAFTAAATCRALRDYPDLNARVLDDAYVRLGDVNLGIAVDTDEGLVVPVIPHADDLTVRGLARAIDDLGQRARDGKLSPDELAGKSFTISNPGRRGNLVGGAIISQPNVGILRMGTIKKRVVVVEGEEEDLMAIHPVMQMALTYDHRVVDGVKANGFLYRVAEILEHGEFEL